MSPNKGVAPVRRESFKSTQNRLGQGVRPARRRGDREQKVLELNSKVPGQDERNKKQESLEVKVYS
jgi:hypothetical protein